MERRRPACFDLRPSSVRRRLTLGARRRAWPRASWRQLLLVLTGIGVAVAMVTIAEMARENADRHRRAQVLVESIRASSEQLNAIRSQALVDTLAGHAARVEVSTPVVASGFRVWRQLT